MTIVRIVGYTTAEVSYVLNVLQEIVTEGIAHPHNDREHHDIGSDGRFRHSGRPNDR